MMIKLNLIDFSTEILVKKENFNGWITRQEKEELKESERIERTVNDEESEGDRIV